MKRVDEPLRLFLPLVALIIATLPGGAAAQSASETQRELDTARKFNEQLKRQLAETEAQLARSQAVIADLKAQNDRLAKVRAELQRLAASRPGAGAKVAEQVSAVQQQELEALRREVARMQADRDKNLRSVVELTDQLHQAFSELKQLRTENARLKALLPEPPPKGLEGRVVAVAENGQVDISLGSDDGLMPGHDLSVRRAKGNARQVVGQIMVVKVTPDRAVCHVVAAPSEGGIVKGDQVSTGEQIAKVSPVEPPKPGTPPRLFGGVVLGTLEDGHVEISFGTADGLRPGHALEVYRETGEEGIYVGRIEVVDVGPKKSRCRIVAEQDTVRKGDRITSSL